MAAQPNLDCYNEESNILQGRIFHNINCNNNGGIRILESFFHDEQTDTWGNGQSDGQTPGQADINSLFFIRTKFVRTVSLRLS